MFKAITEAYDCLRDPDSRAQYDRFGRAGLGGGGGGPPAHFSFEMADSLFRELFSGRSPFAAMFERAGVHAARGAGGSSMPAGHGTRRADAAGDPFSVVFAEMDRMMDMRMPAGGGMHGGGSSTSFSFSSSSSSPGGGSGVVGRSTRTESVVRNGKRVTRTVTTTQYADGRTETSTDEHTDNVGEGDPLFLEGGMGGFGGFPDWHSGGAGGGSSRRIGYG